MKIDVLTLFPEMFSGLKHSLIKRAQQEKKICINYVNIRDFSKNKHKKTDDYTYGGGAGMIMTPQPLYDAISSVKKKDSHVIYMSPSGKLLNNKKIINISKNHTHLILVCGHYEGIDQRIIDLCVDEEISIGDYILTGGEIPAMALIDGVSRYIKGVLGSDSSTKEESFSNNLLEYPQYTRPRIFEGISVPEILISGHHSNIKEWRNQKSIEKTKKVRPDLLKRTLYED